MLHLFNFAFSGHDEAFRCLSRLSDDDRVLFLGNGVACVIKHSPAAGTIQAASENIRLFVLKPDLLARGLATDSLLPGIEPVDYSVFVELAAQQGPVHSWFR